MALIAVCDLCGKPIKESEARVFKVKELKLSWHERYWENIDVHNACMKKLLDSMRPEDDLVKGERLYEFT